MYYACMKKVQGTSILSLLIFLAIFQVPDAYIDTWKAVPLYPRTIYVKVT